MAKRAAAALFSLFAACTSGVIGELSAGTDAGASVRPDSGAGVLDGSIPDAGAFGGDAGPLDSTPPTPLPHQSWFVWPLHFLPGVAERIDLAVFVPGYVPGVTRLDVKPIDSEGRRDSTPLPPFITVEQERYLVYDGSDAGVRNAWGAYRLVASEPSWSSNKVNVIVAAEPSMRIDAGVWSQGTDGGTFETLRQISAAISTGGGWAPIPNTNLTSLWSRAEFNGSFRSWMRRALTDGMALVGNGGPGSLFGVWCSAVFDGRAFIFGACGGHYSHWGNDFYALRLTDPPAVELVHIPFATGAVLNRGDDPAGSPGGGLNWKPPYIWGAFDNTRGEWLAGDSTYERASPVWGPGSVHQYHGLVRSPTTGRIVIGGSNQWYAADDLSEQVTRSHRTLSLLWELDLTQPSPRRAWRPLNVEPLRPTSQKGQPAGDENMFAMPNGDIGIVDWAGLKIRYRALERDLVLDPTLPSVGAATSTRGGVLNAFDGKVYGFARTQQGPTRLRNLTGEVDVGVLPGWASDPNVSFDDMPGIVFPAAGIALIVQAKPQGAHLARINLATGTSDEIELTGLPRGLDGNGIWGRVGWVPQVHGLVVLLSNEADAYFVRPPDAWAL